VWISISANLGGPAIDVIGHSRHLACKDLLPFAGIAFPCCGIVPRWIAFLGYALGVMLLLITGIIVWIPLVYSCVGVYGQRRYTEPIRVARASGDSELHG